LSLSEPFRRYPPIVAKQMVIMLAPLLTDYDNGLTCKLAHSTHDCRIVSANAVAMYLNEIAEYPTHVVNRRRARLMTRKLHRVPRFMVL
jgi:hypothetical protein